MTFTTPQTARTMRWDPEVLPPIVDDRAPFFQYWQQTQSHAREMITVGASPEPDDSLRAPREYALGTEGKLLRPILALMTADYLGVDRKTIQPLVVASEGLHTASLILDDIMDDATLRRRKPALHREFSEDTATLTSLSMVGGFFSQLTKLTEHYPEARVVELVDYCGAGIMRLCDGQQRDITVKPDASFQELADIASRKTSTAIEMGMVSVAILAGSPEADRDIFVEYARHLGVAFQIRDDMIDCSGTDEGKDKDLDHQNGHPNAVVALGGNVKAKLQAVWEVKQAIHATRYFSKNPKRFVELANFVNDVTNL